MEPVRFARGHWQAKKIQCFYLLAVEPLPVYMGITGTFKSGLLKEAGVWQRLEEAVCGNFSENSKTGLKLVLMDDVDVLQSRPDQASTEVQKERFTTGEECRKKVTCCNGIGLQKVSLLTCSCSAQIFSF